MLRRTMSTLAFGLLLLGCDGLEPEDGPAPIDGITITDEGAGLFRMDVNATDENAWVYVDLDERRGVQTPADPTDSADWDIALRRFFVKSNGGVSGSGGVEVAVLEANSIDEVERAPAAGWMSDDNKKNEDDGRPDEVPSSDVDYAFNRANASNENGWYDYNPLDHTLSPADLVFVVRTRAGDYVAVEFLDYYDGAGTPAVLSLRFKRVDAPADEPGISIDSSAGTVYLKLNGTVVAIGDPNASTDWDLAARGVVLRTNGGASGPGLGGAAWADAEASYDALSAASTTGFVEDVELPIPGPPGSGTAPQSPILGDWYDYDSSTHQVRPKDRTLLVRGADGETYAKLKVLSYGDDVMRVRLETITIEVSTATHEIDASDGEAWTYFDLAGGVVVEAETPDTDLHWDLALSKTRMRTNGGTSGAGRAGAVEASAPAMADILEAPVTDYVGDEMLPLPGPPGSGEYSGNPVLATWFDYDPMTHTLDVRDAAFVVRTADANYVKLKIISYDDGRYVIESAFAGPGKQAF